MIQTDGLNRFRNVLPKTFQMIYYTPTKAENLLSTRKTIYLPCYSTGRHNNWVLPVWQDVEHSNKRLFSWTSLQNFRLFGEMSNRIAITRAWYYSPRKVVEIARKKWHKQIVYIAVISSKIIFISIKKYYLLLIK